MPVLVHGPAYSTYTRTVRLALEEKGVAYELREVDLLGGAGQSPEHLARQPWGKVPAFEHDGFALFETFAITRYVDEPLPGPRLQPEGVRERARMTQIVAVLDSYGYGALIGKLFWQHVVVPMTGGAPDQAVPAEARPAVDRVLGVLEGLATGAEGGFLCGGAISLADCHLVPIVDYTMMTEDGRAAFGRHRRLSGWWERIAGRPSVTRTKPSLG
jgi:glutathione S-transferase